MAELSILELKAYLSIDTNEEITCYPKNTPSHFHLLKKKDLKDDLWSKLSRLEKQVKDKNTPIFIKWCFKNRQGETLTTDFATWNEMNPTEIADEFQEQILYIRALEQQIDTLFHIADDALHAESKIAKVQHPVTMENQEEENEVVVFKIIRTSFHPIR